MQTFYQYAPCFILVIILTYLCFILFSEISDYVIFSVDKWHFFIIQCKLIYQNFHFPKHLSFIFY